MRCPECKINNRPNASFCIECGEPLELNNAPEVVRASPAQAQSTASASTTWGGPFGGNPEHKAADNLPFPASMLTWLPSPFNPTGWGLEVRITVLVLLAAIGFDLLSQSIARSDASNYQQGLKDEQQQHWHDAANLLKSLAFNNYQDAADHYKTVKLHADEFDEYDSLAQGAKLDGSLLRAALYYKQANQIEPGYDGVDKALTETLVNAGQLLYQKRDGLYLADATGVPVAALPGSDAATQVLAVSADSQYVAYTGFDVNAPPTRTFAGRPVRPFGGPTIPGVTVYGGSVYSTTGRTAQRLAVRKVYIRNLATGASELFDDLSPSNPAAEPGPPGSRNAAFVNNGRGLLFVVYRNDDQMNSELVDLYYFDIAANAGLQKLATAYTFAWPDVTDTHIYYTPVDSAQPGIQNSIASYNLNTGQSNIIARSSGNIDDIELGGNPTDTPGTRVLFYTASESNRYRIYSKLPPDASTSTMLVDVPDNSDTTRYSFISTSPTSEQAIAMRSSDKQEGWLLQPADGKATSLSDKGWDLLMSNPLYMQYSPDGTQVLVQGTNEQSGAKTWFAVVGSDLQVNLRPSWLPDSAYLRWMSDGKHLYTISANGFSIIDAVSGQQLVYVARKTQPRNFQGTLSLLPGSQTLLYTANEGIYISEVDGKYPVDLLPGATGAWLIPPANK